MHQFLSLSAALLLTGCVASGTQVKQEQLSQFHKGDSSIHDVISALGKPNSQSISTDGNRTACYTFVQSTARPESFIPIVGVFVGGADAHTDMTCFTFDSEGILSNYTSTTAESGAGYGFESGNTAFNDRVASEPQHSKE
jgi:outer membrane protein assembly factor BamE (lipoprotein component of BamABCDE complex)